jgi:hypothetical protein
MVFRAVDTTRVSMAAISDPIAVNTTTHRVLLMSASLRDRLAVEIPGGGEIHRCRREPVFNDRDPGKCPGRDLRWCGASA